MTRLWNQHLDRLLVKMVTRGLRGQAVCREFRALGFSPAVVLARFETLLDNNRVNAPDAEKPFATPVHYAAFILCGRVRSDGGDSGWQMDGRPVRASEVVAHANKALATLGRPPIRWPVTEDAYSGLAARTLIVRVNGRPLEAVR